MATSGSFDTGHRISGSYNTYGHFGWSQESQSIADNQTKINFTFSGRTASSSQWVYTYGASVTVDGQYFGSWEGKMYNGTSMISNSKTIGHSADGTKQFSASGSLSMVESNNYKSGSGSWWLNTIPRKATISSAPNFNDEANPTITYENKAGNSVSSLDACISLTSNVDDIAYRAIPKTGTSYTFNLTEAERNVLRAATTTANTRDVYFFVRTVIGNNTFYDYKKVTLTIVNGNPTFSNFTYADTNSATTTITGNNQYIIQNKSTLRATISSADKAVANKGASMSNYTFAISSYSGSEDYSTSDINKDIGTINATTNQTLTITAKDSRGNTKAVSKTVNIVPYASPAIVPTVTRANNFEAATTIAVSGAMSLLSVAGVTKNAVNSTNGIQYRYKDASSSSWGSWTNIASTTAADGKVSTNSFILTLDNAKAFNFEFKITDKLETKTVSYTLSQGQPQFFIGSDGRTAVGGVPSISKPSSNLGQLEVYGNAYSNGSLLMTLDRVYPVGSIYMSATHSTAQAVANALGGGTWQAFGAGRVPVGVDTTQTEFNTVEKTGGEKTHTLTVSEMPSHQHRERGWFRVQTGVSGGDTVRARANLSADVWDTSMEATGGGQAHNNLQPYITVYMWKRTA